MSYSHPPQTLTPLKADSPEFSYGVVKNTWVVAGPHLRWIAGTEGATAPLTKKDISENMRRLQESGSTGDMDDYLNW